MERSKALAGRRDAAWVLGFVVVCFALRVWAPGPVTETYDERFWLARTDQFIDGVKHGRFDRATPAAGEEVTTMPGLTVMLAGTAGRSIAKASGSFGFTDRVEGPSVASAQVLRAARAVVAGVCAAALGLLVWVSSRLLGRGAAWIAGIVLATDPFLAGHSGLLHTDALVASFGALAIVGAMAALWVHPDDEVSSVSSVSWSWLVGSGVAAGLALLTKLNAIPVLVPGLALVAAVEVARRWRRRRSSAGRWWVVVLQAAVVWTAAAAATVVALWPALWTSPMTQYRRMEVSARLASHPPPPLPWLPVGERHLFVPISVVTRMTPWLLVTGVLAAAVALLVVIRPRPTEGWPSRAVLVVLLAAPLPYVLLLERSPRVFDRYLLPAWPFVALLIGIAGSVALARWAPAAHARELVVAAGLTIALLASAVVAQAPYGTAYTDPLFGGALTERLASLGWGEGVEQLGATIARREGHRCHEVVVAIRYPLRIAIPCGRLVKDAGRSDVEYAVIEVRHRQRRTLPSFDAVPARGRLIQRVRIGGVSYAELWQLTRR